MLPQGLSERLLPIRRRWALGGDSHVRTIISYPPEEAPTKEELAGFVRSAPIATDLFGFRKSRYVVRTPAHTVAWLQSYVTCEVSDLKANFCKADKSFHIALLEYPRTLDRSLAFRLTTRGLGGWTEYRLTFRHVSEPDGPETDFICEE